VGRCPAEVDAWWWELLEYTWWRDADVDAW
jgi:hypothetical protein